MKGKTAQASQSEDVLLELLRRPVFKRRPTACLPSPRDRHTQPGPRSAPVTSCLASRLMTGRGTSLNTRRLPFRPWAQLRSRPKSRRASCLLHAADVEAGFSQNGDRLAAPVRGLSPCGTCTSPDPSLRDKTGRLSRSLRWLAIQFNTKRRATRLNLKCAPEVPA